MAIKTILWDLDGTLLDFLKAESVSLKNSFRKLGLGECTDEMVRLYSSINVKHWKMLERGEITKPEVYSGRFGEFIDELGLSANPLELNEVYENGICDTVALIENSYDLVRELKSGYKQYAVTNGRYDVQKRRLEDSGFSNLFDGVFISDEIGYEKPSIEFFNCVLENIQPCKKEEIIIVGDSLSSDMHGGNNAKIKCCWYNPKGAENTTDLVIDYEIRFLDEIKNILMQNNS